MTITETGTPNELHTKLRTQMLASDMARKMTQLAPVAIERLFFAMDLDDEAVFDMTFVIEPLGFSLLLVPK